MKVSESENYAKLWRRSEKEASRMVNLAKSAIANNWLLLVISALN